MVDSNVLKKGDVLEYSGIYVTFVEVKNDMVIIEDPELGEMNIFKDIFEKNYSLKSL